MEMVLARMRQPAAKADDDEKHQRNTERNEGTERSQDGMAAVPSPARKQQKSGADDDDEESEDSDTMLVEAAAAEEENAAVVQDGGAASDDDGDDDDDDGGEVPEMRGSFPRVTCVAPKPFQGYGDDTTKFLAKFGLARAAPAQNTKARKGSTLNGNKLGRGPPKHKAGGRNLATPSSRRCSSGRASIQKSLNFTVAGAQLWCKGCRWNIGGAPTSINHHKARARLEHTPLDSGHTAP
jgi:hypothetical protein